MGHDVNQENNYSGSVMWSIFLYLILILRIMKEQLMDLKMWKFTGLPELEHLLPGKWRGPSTSPCLDSWCFCCVHCSSLSSPPSDADHRCTITITTRFTEMSEHQQFLKTFMIIIANLHHNHEHCQPFFPSPVFGIPVASAINPRRHLQRGNWWPRRCTC